MSHDPASPSIACSVEGGLARLVLDQPDRGNPIDGRFCRDLREIVCDLSERPDLRAVLMTARGRVFSVGGDITSFSRDRAALPGIVKTWTADLHVAIARLMRLSAPVVAAVHGNVAGGSVSLVASADIVYAVPNARFAAAFPLIGFSSDSGSTVTLTQRMGIARAKRFLLLGETLKAEEAQATGLVDFVVAEAQLQEEAEAAAMRFAAGATQAYGGIKRLMLGARTESLETQMENEAQTLASISRSDDAWEGLAAFAARRPARFRGR